MLLLKKLSVTEVSWLKRDMTFYQNVLVYFNKQTVLVLPEYCEISRLLKILLWQTEAVTDYTNSYIFCVHPSEGTVTEVRTLIL